MRFYVKKKGYFIYSLGLLIINCEIALREIIIAIITTIWLWAMQESCKSSSWKKKGACLILKLDFNNQKSINWSYRQEWWSKLFHFCLIILSLVLIVDWASSKRKPKDYPRKLGTQRREKKARWGNHWIVKAFICNLIFHSLILTSYSPMTQKSWRISLTMRIELLQMMRLWLILWRGTKKQKRHFNVIHNVLNLVRKNHPMSSAKNSKDKALIKN